MKLPSKTTEKRLIKKGYNTVIAVDEVGMGSLAGPVVVCAVMLDKKFFQKTHPNLSGIKDSKLLNSKQRERLFQELLQVSRPLGRGSPKAASFKFHVSFSYPKTIDRLNIYQAARLAMLRATLHLYNTNKKTIVLVDGPHKIGGLKLDQLPIVKGDRKVFAIACASIIAKVTRDKMMARYAKQFPGYGFEKHKGYGTKFHQSQLLSLGPSPIHRFSFAPVNRLG